MLNNPPSSPDLLREVIESYREHYSDLCDSWRDTERKAQGTIAICGIFLAGVLAFTRLFVESDGSSVATKIVLTGSILLLGTSVAMALWSMIVRRTRNPPFAGDFGEMVSDIISHNDVTDPERVENLYHDTLTSWRSANQSIEESNETKANWVLGAQLVLFLGLALAISIPVHSVWNDGEKVLPVQQGRDQEQQLLRGPSTDSEKQKEEHRER
ncbi:MAG: hypothetical protein AAGJ40_09365 [Planctomycetota bacterium]